MNCPKCDYERNISFRCARCFEPKSYNGSFEEYMLDYLEMFKISNTKLYIFPTVLGGEKSVGHSSEEGFEKSKIFFLR